MCTPLSHSPPHIRFSDAVCLVALFLPLKLSSAACLSSRPLSPCIDLCMLEAFTSSCVQDSSLVMFPLRLTLRSGLHTWPSVPGFALRSTGGFEQLCKNKPVTWCLLMTCKLVLQGQIFIFQFTWKSPGLNFLA